MRLAPVASDAKHVDCTRGNCGASVTRTPSCTANRIFRRRTTAGTFPAGIELAANVMEVLMSDPRNPLNTPRGDRSNAWAWIAGIVVLILIALFIFGYGNRTGSNSTATGPGTNTQGTASAPARPANPPSTTGQGGR